MKKFVLVYYGGTKPEDMNPEDTPAIMEAWGKWYEMLGESLVDGGNPFASNGMKIDEGGTASQIESEEWPSKGYTIVQAESIESAVEMAKNNPMLSSPSEKGDVQVRVYECLPM